MALGGFTGDGVIFGLNGEGFVKLSTLLQELKIVLGSSGKNIKENI